MGLFKDINTLPEFNNPVITIGTFDGVHLGHRLILSQLKEEAVRTGGESVVITFDPHPRHFLPSHSRIDLLSTPEEKYRIIFESGVDHIVTVPFDSKFAAQTATEYIREFLVKKFRPRLIIIGYDHRFGLNREGDYHLLEKEGANLGFEVKEIPVHVIQQVAISSTRIRESLKEGNIDQANQFLGYEYKLSGVVIEGNKIGRSIGFPTANMDIHPEKLIPANGVYAVRFTIQQAEGKGMMNIGYRPTVRGNKRTVEAHLLDFNKDIYGELLEVALVKRLRDEIKFNGLEELKMQLLKDREQALEVLSGPASIS